MQARSNQNAEWANPLVLVREWMLLQDFSCMAAILLRQWTALLVSPASRMTPVTPVRGNICP